MKTKAFIYIILAGVLWGTSSIFVHYLAPLGFSSLQMTAVRGLVALTCLSVFALIRDRSLFKIKKPVELLVFVGLGVSLFLTASCYYTSMQMTSVSTAVVLMYMSPVYVMVFSVLFMGEKFSKLKLISVVSMIVGCCLVSGIIGGIKFDLVGILIGFASGLAYAAYNILVKVAVQRGNRPVSVTIYNFVFMTLVALSVSKPWQIVTTAAAQPLKAIPLLIGLGIATSVLPYLLLTLSMRDLPAGTASALSIVEPMAATIFSVVLLKTEVLDWSSAVGIVLILGAVFMLGKAEGKEEN